jgi:hypothetical protein
MKVHGRDHRATRQIACVPCFRAEFAILLLLILATVWQAASTQPTDTTPTIGPSPLTVEQVVRNLAQMNLHRVEALHAYQATRIYRVVYLGFPANRNAEMVVKVNYLSPGKKEFIIQSATGSELIVDRVLKKLLEAEKEAMGPEIQQRSALTDDNYRFTLIGYESTPSGSMYVLSVEPRRKDKFLYQGRIWVDARDFAVVRIEAEPVKNPSFWTRKTDIVQVYTKVSEFWLPAYNHSVTSIRLGGNADLTIEYTGYKITDASQVSSLEIPRSTLRAEAKHAQE